MNPFLKHLNLPAKTIRELNFWIFTWYILIGAAGLTVGYLLGKYY